MSCDCVCDFGAVKVQGLLCGNLLAIETVTDLGCVYDFGALMVQGLVHGNLLAIETVTG